MIRRPRRSTRTDTRFPETTRYRAHTRPKRLIPDLPEHLGVLVGDGAVVPDRFPADHPDRRGGHAGGGVDAEQLFWLGRGGDGVHPPEYRDDHYGRAGRFVGRDPQLRSEEHTSELQSLMRISYAVFCLKKKKHTKQTTI